MNIRERYNLTVEQSTYVDSCEKWFKELTIEEKQTVLNELFSKVDKEPMDNMLFETYQLILSEQSSSTSKINEEMGLVSWLKVVAFISLFASVIGGLAISSMSYDFDFVAFFIVCLLGTIVFCILNALSKILILLMEIKAKSLK